MKTKLINALILWLLMIPLSGIALMTKASEEPDPIGDPTHFGDVTVYDNNIGPIENVKVSMTLYMFGKDTINSVDKVYGFTDYNGFIHLELSKPEWVKNDSIVTILITQVEDSFYCSLNCDLPYTENQTEIISNHEIVTWEEYKKLSKNIGYSIESNKHYNFNITAYDDINYPSKISGVTFKARVHYFVNRLFVDSPPCTTNASGTATISNLSVPDYGYMFPHVLQIYSDDRYYIAVSNPQLPKTNPSTTLNLSLRLRRPKLNIYVNNDHRFEMELSNKTQYSSIALFNQINSSLNQYVVEQLNNISNRVGAWCGGHAHYNGRYASFELLDGGNIESNLTFSSNDNIIGYVKVYKPHMEFELHTGRWCMPDFWVTVNIDYVQYNFTYGLNNGICSTWVDYPTPNIHASSSFFSIGEAATRTAVRNGLNEALNDMNADTALMGPTFNDITLKLQSDIIPHAAEPYLNTISTNSKWLFSDISTTIQFNLGNGNVNFHLDYQMNKVISNGTLSGKVKSLNTISTYDGESNIVESGTSLFLAAVNSISLKPGFHAQENSEFWATCSMEDWSMNMLAGGGFNPNMSYKTETSSNVVSMNDDKDEAGDDKSKLHKSQPEDLSRPASFALSQNYPNPFNPTTTIKYALKEDVKVSLKIYNSLGQEVRTLVNEHQNAGFREIMWDGKNNQGSAVPSGVYIYRLVAGSSFVKANKMMLMK